MSDWLHRLMLKGLEDDDVRQDAVLEMYEGAILNVITSLAASAAFYWHYEFVRNNFWLILALCIWCGSTFYQLNFEKKMLRFFPAALFMPKPVQVQAAKLAARSRHAIVANSYLVALQSFCLSLVTYFALKNDAQELNSPAVIGALLYYFGGTLKNIRCDFICKSYSVILLLPIIFHFAFKGEVQGIVIAVFFALLIFTMITFAQTTSLRIAQQVLQSVELKVLNENLAIEKIRADSANEAKSRFFTAASHDARQPLQAIALLSDSLVRSPHLNADDRRLVDRIASNLDSIRGLFNRVLDISRIESGSIEVSREVFALQTIFDRLDAQFGERAAAKGLWLRILRSDVNVAHDAQLLERMLGNLLDNAIKFTDKGGVWLAYRAQRSRIEVRDTGRGMSELDQTRVFEEFYQVGNSARSREEGAGLGLGLSIVQRLSHLTQTPIGLRSALGAGSVFWMRLAPSLQAPKSDKFIPTDSQKLRLASDGAASALALKGWRLAIVEDDAELRDLLAERLQNLGAHVTRLADALHFAAWLEHKQPRIDGLLTDFRLGEGGSGLDVIRLVRQTLGESLPVIVITGDTAAQGMQELANMRAVHVMYKPVEIAELAAQCVRMRQLRSG